MLRRFIDVFRYLWAVLPLILPVTDGHMTVLHAVAQAWLSLQQRFIYP